MFDLTPEMYLGKPTIHVPINIICQNMSDDRQTVIGVFQTRQGQPLLWDSKSTHQLILGDAFIRPRLVAESNSFRGGGFSGLVTDGFMSVEKWETIFVRG